MPKNPIPKLAALAVVLLLGSPATWAAGQTSTPPVIGNPTLAAPAPPPGAGRAGRRWLHRNPRPQQIYGRQLMTKQECIEYQAQIDAAQTADERLKLRQEHRALMLERAKERGITLPPPPQP
ncbi:MAG: hypothetical protein M0Z90_07185 [Desulfobacteraceae bacterium]|nr:hypothetical protein [Desulfobacteraceae bacterium]